MSADGLPPLREVIAAHGLAARKSLGQNFLLDLNLTRRIARVAAPLDNATVYEVGPGPGGLTRALLMEGAARVIAVERDARCLAALAEVAAHYPGRLDIINADALEVEETALVSGHAPVKVVANLPYNVGTVLLTKWLTATPWPAWFSSLTLMFQKEVAQRLVARPGSKEYGRLAVLAQYRAEVKIAFDVSPQAFVPPPKVTSSVVHLTPRADLPGKPAIGSLERITAAAFGQRRKMLRSSLKSLGGDPLPLLEAAAIDPTARAEDVSVADFARLATVWEDRC